MVRELPHRSLGLTLGLALLLASPLAGAGSPASIRSDASSGARIVAHSPLYGAGAFSSLASTLKIAVPMSNTESASRACARG